jgi:hypothetical protein
MSATEELLRQSLRTLDREVEVSEDDLTHARHRFMHRLAQQQRRRRSVAGMAVAAAVATVAVGGALVMQALDSPGVVPAAPSGDGQPTEPTATKGTSSLTAEDLVGVWLVDGWLWEFSPDGKVSIDDTFTARADMATSEVGSSEFSLHGGLLDVHGQCSWRVTMESEGRLTGVLQGPDGTPRDCGQWPVGVDLIHGDMPDEENWEWVRISDPVAQGLSSVDASTAPAPRELSPVGLSGVWWQEDGDVLFISVGFDRRIAYRLDNDGDLLRSPDDIGAGSLDGAAGTLTLTTDRLIARLGGEPPTCRPGDQATMTGLSLAVHKSSGGAPLQTLNVDASTGSCEAHEDLDGVWVKLF